MKDFQRDFRAVAQCGILMNGGVTRLALTREDQEARHYLIQTMRALGLAVHIDAVGNIHGVRAGRNPQAKRLVIGSHLDTVPQGGHYDGVVGVLAGLDVVRRLNQSGISTEHSIEVVDFTAEESSRYGVATLGSKALTGRLSPQDLQQIVDREGQSIYSALQQMGCNPERLPMEQVHADELLAYLELHIEQGPVLEQQGLDVGLVTAIAGPSRFRVRLEGRSDHSGNTPMTMRRDALAGAAEIVLAVERIAQRAAAETVATVGVLHCEPGVINVIPGLAELAVDIRDIHGARKDEIRHQIQQEIRFIAQRRHLKVTIDELCHDQPVMLSPSLMKSIEDQANRIGLSLLRMPSGAGHDAMHFAGLAPTALIFIPSIDGVSHNIAEKSSLDAISKGVDLLFATVIELALPIPA